MFNRDLAENFTSWVKLLMVRAVRSDMMLHMAVVINCHIPDGKQSNVTRKVHYIVTPRREIYVHWGSTASMDFDSPFDVSCWRQVSQAQQDWEMTGITESLAQLYAESIGNPWPDIHPGEIGQVCRWIAGGPRFIKGGITEKGPVFPYNALLLHPIVDFESIYC